MNAPVIDIENLTLQLRGTTVLDRISLTLQQGEFLGIIGPNGGGKTTLLRVLLGLLEPTGGSVKVFGASPAEARGRVGYVPQYARFDMRFPISVLDVVLAGRLGPGRSFGRYRQSDREIALASLEQVMMTDFASKEIGRLSGGQMQRVLIARALAMQPQLLLLDEPTASVDSPGGKNVYAVLDELSKQMTIVLVSHDIGVISAHVQLIACLNRRLHFHHTKEITSEILEEVYGCPVDLIAHGHAHRVLAEHEGAHGTHAHPHEKK